MFRQRLSRPRARAWKPGLLPGLQARADDYPSRPVKIIVPFGPAARPTPCRASSRMGYRANGRQTVVIENRPGAAGNIGADVVCQGQHLTAIRCFRRRHRRW